MKKSELRQIIREEIQKLNEGVITISTSSYKRAHGKEPNGRGLWMFFFDKKDYDKTENDFQFNGTYQDAIKAAKIEAQKRNKSLIIVGS